MTTNKLIKALQRLKVKTGSIACLGCGHEHNCGIHGCAIIREAAEKLGDFNAVFDEDTVVRLDGQCLKVEPGRLRELAEADKAGRLVVLPCKPGDTVYTSGFSAIFPKDIPVGVTVDSRLKDGATYNLEVKLFENFSSLKYVTIVSLMDDGEIEKLEKEGM